MSVLEKVENQWSRRLSHNRKRQKIKLKESIQKEKLEKRAKVNEIFKRSKLRKKKSQKLDTCKD